MAMVTGCTARTGVNYALAAPDTRICAWGLRNPWRFWIDPQTDLLWIGDVGEATEEEITVGRQGRQPRLALRRGQGSTPRRSAAWPTARQMTPSTACVPPADSYPRGERRPRSPAA